MSLTSFSKVRKIMKRFFAFLCFLLYAFVLPFLLFYGSKAHSTTLGVHTVSYHLSDNDKWNNNNAGVYLSLDEQPLKGLSSFVGRPTFGIYNNSYSKVSAYAGYNLSLFPHVDVLVGVISGYPPARKYGIMPLVAPSFVGDIGNGMAVRVVFLPKVEKNGAAVVHLMLEHSF